MRRGLIRGVALVASLAAAAGCASDGGDGAATGGTAAGTTPGTAAPAVDVVTSADGNMRVEIPEGALPDGVSIDDITVTALGAEDLPGPLAGAELRSAFYALEPHGLEFSEPVQIVRRYDAAGSGFDLADGIPYTTLVTSDPAGATWDVPTDQQLSLEGDAVVVSGWVTHFSYAFAFNGGVSVGLGPDPARAPVGAAATIDLRVSGPEDARLSMFIENVEADDGIVVDWDGFDPRLSVQCGARPGTYTFTVEVRLEEGLSVAAIAALASLAIPYERANETVVLTGTIECVGEEPPGTPPPPPTVDPVVQLASIQVCIVHDPIAGFRSYLRWLITLSGSGAKGAESVAITPTGGANGGQPVEAPVSGATAEADTGIPAYGTYGIEEMLVRNTNGSTVDLTEAAVALFGEGILVGPEETCTTVP